MAYIVKLRFFQEKTKELSLNFSKFFHTFAFFHQNSVISRDWMEIINVKLQMAMEFLIKVSTFWSVKLAHAFSCQFCWPSPVYLDGKMTAIAGMRRTTARTWGTRQLAFLPASSLLVISRILPRRSNQTMVTLDPLSPRIPHLYPLPPHTHLHPPWNKWIRSSQIM